MRVFKTNTRTAVTEWIERMTSDRYKEDDLADVFELCEVINIQATGPKEASKAIKRALKYGNVHSQIRAVTILKALAENCGDKFVAQIATYKFTERLRIIATSPYTDSKVHKRLLMLFAEWSTEFKNKPGYEILANLHNGSSHRSNTSSAGYATGTRGSGSRSTPPSSSSLSSANNKEKNKNVSSGGRSKKVQQTERQPVTYTSEKINEAIGLSTQNATNLINALTLLSPGSDLEANSELQELIRKCKSTSELLIKMISSVADDNKSQLGPLLQSNEQVLGALQIYSDYNKQDDDDDDDDDDVNDVTSGINDFKLQRQKEKNGDVSGFGSNKKKNQAEEAAKIHKDFGDLIDFDSFSSNISPNHAADDDDNSAYTDPFADPFADPEPTETVNEPKRRLRWAEV